jgi:putative FmdB family regulatory protein
MPIYEYKCPNNHHFEVFHGMTEAGPTVCEVCGAEPLQRVLHPVAVHYKGSGFYSTDYGRGGRKPKDSGSGDSGSSGSGSSDSGSGGSGSSDSGSSSSDNSSSPYNADTTKKIKESGGGSSGSSSSD